jgi:hypothetical protein
MCEVVKAYMSSANEMPGVAQSAACHGHVPGPCEGSGVAVAGLGIDAGPVTAYGEAIAVPEVVDAPFVVTAPAGRFDGLLPKVLFSALAHPVVRWVWVGASMNHALAVTMKYGPSRA